MNLFSLIIAGFFALLLAAFVTLLAVAIVFNLGAGKRYRQSLATQLDSLRLSKMLAALGIDIDEYLHSERVVDIHDQIQRCSDCSQTAECDSRLASGEVDSEAIGFCDNEQSLLSIVESKKASQQ